MKTNPFIHDPVNNKSATNRNNFDDETQSAIDFNQGRLKIATDCIKQGFNDVTNTTCKSKIRSLLIFVTIETKQSNNGDKSRREDKVSFVKFEKTVKYYNDPTTTTFQ